MPALPPVPNTLKISLRFGAGADQNIFTRLFFAYSGAAPSNADCLAIGTAVDGSFNARLAAFLSANDLVHDETVTDLSSAVGGTAVHASAVVGTRAGVSLPAGVAVLINHRIHRRYRGGKPRSYMPLFVDGDLTSPAVWNAAQVAALNAAYALFISDISAIVAGATSLGAHVNVSYFQGFTASQNPVTHRWRNVPNVRAAPITDVITSSSVNSIPGSSRKRYLR